MFGNDPTSTKTTIESKQEPEIKVKTTRAAQTEITNSVIATQTEEDTPIFRQKVLRIPGVRFIAPATKKIETYVFR